MSDDVRLTAWVHGYVQGVGFRWWTRSRALELGLACAPYLYVVFRIAAARIPNAHGEIAASLGHGAFARLLRVHLPAYAVPIAAGLLIVFAQTLGDYAAAERLGIATLSVGIHNLWFASQSSAVAAVVSSVLIVPCLVLVWFREELFLWPRCLTKK